MDGCCGRSGMLPEMHEDGICNQSRNVARLAESTANASGEKAAFGARRPPSAARVAVRWFSSRYRTVQADNTVEFEICRNREQGFIELPRSHERRRRRGRWRAFAASRSPARRNRRRGVLLRHFGWSDRNPTRVDVVASDILDSVKVIPAGCCFRWRRRKTCADSHRQCDGGDQSRRFNAPAEEHHEMKPPENLANQ